MRRAAAAPLKKTKVASTGQVDFKSCQCLETTGLCSWGTTVKGSPPSSQLFNILFNFISVISSCLPLPLQRLLVKLVRTFLPPGEDVSGGGVLVIFSGLEPQLEGDDPLILKYGQNGMNSPAT